MCITLCMLCNKWEERSRRVVREGRRFNLPCLPHYFGCPKIPISCFHILNSSSAIPFLKRTALIITCIFYCMLIVQLPLVECLLCAKHFVYILFIIPLNSHNTGLQPHNLLEVWRG